MYSASTRERIAAWEFYRQIWAKDKSQWGRWATKIADDYLAKLRSRS